MAVHLSGCREGFGAGLTEITRIDEAEHDTGIAFSILRLAVGETLDERPAGESAYLLLDGRIEVAAGNAKATWSRLSLFDERPSCLHVCAGATVALRCAADAELALFRTANTASFAPRLFAPDDVRGEARGRGQVHDAALRFVRTIFDGGTSDPATDLVLGEVVSLPGRWSSYPPHHHPQPEIYHYRFTAPHGYGHAELGEQVLKVRHTDTVKIIGGNDHAQVAAPGYGMYYIWAIRHLPGDRYDVPVFAEEHRWVMENGARHWWPAGVDDGA